MAGWCGRDLDQALAETITLTVDDVLLPELLGRLDPTPLARRLLLGVAVYRHPVDRIGLAWQIAPIQQPPADPDRDQRMRATGGLITEMRRSGQPASEVGLTEAMLQQHQRDWRQLRHPPLAIPPDLDEALTTLLTLGLIAPLPSPDPDKDTEHYLVHRWTATALTKQTDTEELIEAHRRAAQFWQWRVDVWPQDRTTDIQQLVEARYHHHQTRDLDNAIAVTDRICQQLHTWGAWTWEEDLCTETLTWLSPRSAATAAVTHQLGMIAQQRGDYAQAEQHYQAALTINEELNHRAGIAASYAQLGRIALDRGEYTQAEQRYQAALTISEELGERVGIATSYHQLGVIARLRGDYTQAEQRYQAALAISEELGNRAGIAESYVHLSAIAQLRGDYARAEQHCQAGLTITKELGDRAGIAASYHQLGELRTEQGRPAEGIPYTISALVMRLQLESPEVSSDIFWLARQRQEVGEEGFTEILGNLLDADSVRFVIDAVNTMEQRPGAAGS